jgi:trans-aconitate methyltransferase
LPLSETLSHLSRLYAASDDPWNHRSSPYEAAKYEATLEAIGLGPFENALEIGCGNGKLARRLAPRCRRLIAMECIPAAADAARHSLAEFAQVEVLEGSAPGDLPKMQPDLVVLSEVLYFTTPQEIALLGQWLSESAAGPIVAVNWTGPTDEPLKGAEAVGLLANGLVTERTHCFSGLQIDVLAPVGRAFD